MKILPIFYHGVVDSCAVSNHTWNFDILTDSFSQHVRNLLNTKLVGGIFVTEDSNTKDVFTELKHLSNAQFDEITTQNRNILVNTGNQWRVDWDEVQEVGV